MAKGDDSRARNQLDYQGKTAQNHLDNLRKDTIVPQNQTLWNNYLGDREADQADLEGVKSNFNDFAKTGGYSSMDLSNIRSRAVSPIRAMYANANREVDRSKTLQGGYAPGFGTLKARMAREASSAASDATTNAEGMIAGMVNDGKRFGSSGLLSAYGTTPGRSAMSQNGMLQSTNQQLELANLQNKLGMDIVGNQIETGKMPGKFDHTMGRIKDIAGTALGIWSGATAGGGYDGGGYAAGRSGRGSNIEDYRTLG